MAVTDVGALKIRADYGQARIRRERLVSVTSGAYVPAGLKVKNGWSGFWGTKHSDGRTFETWVDPITSTLMLAPAPLLPSWQTTNTGIYARIPKSSFTFVDSTAWYESPKNGSASNYLILKDSDAASANRYGITTANFSANQPTYVSWFDWNWGADKAPRLVIGFGRLNTGIAPDTTNTAVGIAFYGDGQAEVWINGELSASYPYASKDDDETKQGQNTAQRFITAMIFPMGGGILVVTNQGGGFFHPLDGYDQNDPTQVITPEAPFWFLAPIGKAEVEVAKIQFPATAYRAALKTVWMEAPEAGEVPTFTVYASHSSTSAAPGDGVVAALQNTLVATPFVPDGVTRDCRTRLTLSGGPSSTPYVFGVMSGFDPIQEDTDDSEELDVTPQVTQWAMECPESWSGVKMSMTVRDPAAIDPEGTARLESIGSRPLAAVYVDADGEDRWLMDGISGDPEEEASIADYTKKVYLEARDYWSIFETVSFSDDFPLDGMTLGAAYDFMARSAGLSGDQIDIGADAYAFTLPQSAAGRGDWALLVKRGDKVAHWLERLHSEYSATFFMGVKPSADPLVRKVFTVMSPDELGREPKLRIFHRMAWAKTYIEDTEGVADAADIRWVAGHRTYRNQRKVTLRPESTDIWVMGIDRKTMRPILAHYPDRDRQDPSVAPSLRVLGWRGLLDKYGLYLPSLNTKNAVIRACKLLFKRLCHPRELIEWEGEQLIDPDTLLPLWRGDCVELEHSHHTEVEVDPDTGEETTIDVADVYLVRILSWSAASRLEVSDAAAERPSYVRPTRYTAEILVDVTEGLEGEPRGSDGVGHVSALAGTLKAALAAFRWKVAYTRTTGPEPAGDGPKPPIDVYILPDDDDEDA